MKDNEKTREQLLAELKSLRKKVTSLEALKTDQTHVELELQNSKKVLEMIINHIPNQVFWKNRDLVYSGCNQAFAEVTGMGSPAEVIGKSDYDFHRDSTHADSYRQWDENIMKNGEAVLNIEEFYHNSDGTEGTVLTSKVPLRDKEGKVFGLVGICTDISERKKMELEKEAFELKQADALEMVRQSEAHLESVFRAAPVGIGVVVDRVLSQVNNSMCEMTGYSKEELVGRDARMLYPSDEESEYVGKEKYIQIRNHGTGPVETHWQRKDGHVIDVLLSSTPIDLKDLIKGVTFTALDITERKLAEKALLESEEKLARAKKMEAVGLLAGGVAHDLNNVLSGIVSYPELLLTEMPEDSKYRKSINTIQRAGFKAAAIVQDLLTVARGVAITKEPLNLNKLVKDYLNSPECRNLEQFYPTVSIKPHLDSDLLNISGSSVHISKVLMNLVSNASEAIDGSGNVTISTRNRYVDRPIKGYDEVKKGEYAVLTVSDNGSGVSSQDLERIFEPFYTKKVMGRSGTGLGLAVVWSAMRDHNGYIDVKSDESGTTFELYFPITRDDILDTPLFLSLNDYMGNGETVLVVDDLESQRVISCEMLDKLGYKTKAVSSGEEAVEYVKEHHVDLLLLDMIMDPGMNGRETYEKILKHHPRQKAVIVSGFSDTHEVRETQRLGAGKYIKKPFTLETIGVAVKEELEK